MKIKGWIFETSAKPLEMLLRIIQPIDNSIIVFNSRPDYSDNARALSDYLINNDYLSKYKIYWVVEDSQKCRDFYPKDNVNFIENKGLKRFRNLFLFTKANYILATHVLPYYTSKNKKGQHFINLWHGCGYKDKDLNHKKRKNDLPPFDKALVAGPLFVKTKSYCWNLPIENIIAKGYPRYDWLKNPTEKEKKLYENIKGNNVKIVMWMPTFRVDKYGLRNDSNNIKYFPLLHTKRDWIDLDMYCQKKHILLLVKLHIYQKDYEVDWKELMNIRSISNSDFDRNGVNMYSFLALTDGLISDYSSVAVDYIIVNKPIAFALDDYDLYRNSRGFVFEEPRKYMPGHHLYNIDDLKCFLNDVIVGNDLYRTNRWQLCDKLIHHSTNYCKEIADELQL